MLTYFSHILLCATRSKYLHFLCDSPHILLWELTFFLIISVMFLRHQKMYRPGCDECMMMICYYEINHSHWLGVRCIIYSIEVVYMKYASTAHFHFFYSRKFPYWLCWFPSNKSLYWVQHYLFHSVWFKHIQVAAWSSNQSIRKNK